MLHGLLACRVSRLRVKRGMARCHLSHGASAHDLCGPLGLGGLEVERKTLNTMCLLRCLGALHHAAGLLAFGFGEAQDERTPSRKGMPLPYAMHGASCPCLASTDASGVS